MAKMNIYGCGGAGLNIAYDFLKYQDVEKEDDGFSSVSTFFIDTSRSNIRKDAPDSQIYLFDSLDGSGKKRDANYSAIAERTREMLHEFTPGDINIVVHSASGGSGSVIGPLLVSEMLGKHNVIVAIIGSSDSRIETDNTCKTLKSYEAISRKREFPICAFYYENTPESPRGPNNNRLIQDLVMVSLFFSGQNPELDKADLTNFLNYTKVTSWPGAFSKLRTVIGTSKLALPKNEVAVSCATLTTEHESSVVEEPVEYQGVGFISKEGHSKLSGIETMATPYHLVVSSGFFLPVIESLSKKIKVHDDYRSTIVHKSILTDNDLANDDGMIL